MQKKFPLSLILCLILPLMLFVTLGLALRVWPVQALPEAIINVDTLADESDGSCSDGDCSLRDAIATANPDDSVQFTVSGTVVLSPTLGQLVVDKSMSISSSLPITISGGSAVRVFKVVTNTTPSVAVTFNGLIISQGNHQGTDCESLSMSCGGGVLIGNSTAVTITNSILFDNSANDGGGIYIHGREDNASLTIYQSTIISNTATNNGGGIFNDGNDGNANLMISHSTFSTNSAVFSGGGIYSLGGSGLARLTITSSTLDNNSADYGGGIYYSDDGGNADFTISHSTLFDNSAGIWGGGIFNDGFSHSTSLTITHSTLYSNSADSGGGIYNFSSTGNAKLILVNTTLANNSADNGGGRL